MKKQYLLPNNYLSKHERQKPTGEIYWLLKHKREFCELYLDKKFEEIDKYCLHSFMMEKRGGLIFTKNGLPDWKYTDEPIKLTHNL